jgi:hypothetical protein
LDSRESDIQAVMRAWCRVEPETSPAALRLDQDDWERLAATAEREGVAGLVHRAVADDPAGVLVPERVFSGLRQIAREQAAAHAWQETALGEALDSLERAGLSPVLLRGHALVASLYGYDGSLRPQLDHDLLVPHRAMGDARRELRRLGFEDSAGTRDVFSRDDVTVDLHHDPYDRSRVPSRGRVILANPDGVLRRAVETRVAGRQVLQPCPSDRVLLLSTHLVKHSFDRLIRMVDIAECWRQTPPDPEVVESRARREGTADAVYYALTAARTRLGAPVPPGLLVRLEPPRRRWIDRAFNEVLHGRRPRPFFAERLLLSQLRSWRERLTAVGEMLWTPEHQSRISTESMARRFVAAPERMVDVARRALTRQDY